jgi:hypothetical protein
MEIPTETVGDLPYGGNKRFHLKENNKTLWHNLLLQNIITGQVVFISFSNVKKF